MNCGSQDGRWPMEPAAWVHIHEPPSRAPPRYSEDSRAAGPSHYNFGKGEGARSSDMVFMLLCSFVAFSQFMWLNPSATTLHTVSSSRRCGAIPEPPGWERGM
ncbi:unnamed protein product [Gulo gulo]|uniref:Uncharacterized protein n=1 Tax=Gulo gulo TaxID=48420 RepID=A0A9X9M8E3_GULGU|nr:unnamed protein product [Gulo gulo]